MNLPDALITLKGAYKNLGNGVSNNTKLPKLIVLEIARIKKIIIQRQKGWKINSLGDNDSLIGFILAEAISHEKVDKILKAAISSASSEFCFKTIIPNLLQSSYINFV